MYLLKYNLIFHFLFKIKHFNFLNLIFSTVNFPFIIDLHIPFIYDFDILIKANLSINLNLSLFNRSTYNYYSIPIYLIHIIIISINSINGHLFLFTKSDLIYLTLKLKN